MFVTNHLYTLSPAAPAFILASKSGGYHSPMPRREERIRFAPTFCTWVYCRIIGDLLVGRTTLELEPKAHEPLPPGLLYSACSELHGSIQQFPNSTSSAIPPPKAVSHWPAAPKNTTPQIWYPVHPHSLRTNSHLSQYSTKRSLFPPRTLHPWTTSVWPWSPGTSAARHPACSPARRTCCAPASTRT